MSPRAVALAVVLAASSHATSAPAQSATPPHDVFEAIVKKVGRAPGFLCGDMAAVQELDVEIVRVSSGHFHRGDAPALPVLLCTGAPLLRLVPGARAPVYEIDPAKVKPGTHLAFDVDAASKGGTGWVFPTEIRVLP